MGTTNWTEYRTDSGWTFRARSLRERWTRVEIRDPDCGPLPLDVPVCELRRVLSAVCGTSEELRVGEYAIRAFQESGEDWLRIRSTKNGAIDCSDSIEEWIRAWPAPPQPWIDGPPKDPGDYRLRLSGGGVFCATTRETGELYVYLEPPGSSISTSRIIAHQPLAARSSRESADSPEPRRCEVPEKIGKTEATRLIFEIVGEPQWQGTVEVSAGPSGFGVAFDSHQYFPSSAALRQVADVLDRTADDPPSQPVPDPPQAVPVRINRTGECGVALKGTYASAVLFPEGHVEVHGNEDVEVLPVAEPTR
jgi:hypothetical protein